ncbi:hypothetical protein RXV94_09175 [Yeosuana sp. MJ-SS3]|uniref:Uncharacterized protein n=1 Tax=Gilvirhabdus luticola TaxID=3079858 RepID=A0ABU3U7E6_9FLAO|nr:hypothetical protein [Yeosuana sp. MJ-SS3]MDU8886330.1 hypothetical protein [Yeosuana sp. MJ-SS3]
MKKIVLILFAIFLNIGVYSCEPQNIDDGTSPPVLNDEDAPIIPPPPPPSGG